MLTGAFRDQIGIAVSLGKRRCRHPWPHGTLTVRDAQSATINSVLDALDQRSKTLKSAAGEVLEMEPPIETAYNPISAADAVIQYAHNFVPSWAGAIAFDLLPGILVFVLAVTQSAIRNGRDRMSIEDMPACRGQTEPQRDHMHVDRNLGTGHM